MAVKQPKLSDKEKEELPNFESFASICCEYCNSEDYCPSYCDMLAKAGTIEYNKIVNIYKKHDGDLSKVSSYIKRHKER